MAFNEKSFRAPDNAHLQPFEEPINEARPIHSVLTSGIDTDRLISRVNAVLREEGEHPEIRSFIEPFYERLTEKEGPSSTKDPLSTDPNSLQKKQELLEKMKLEKEQDLLNEQYVIASQDPGRFLCNYIYYRSLEFCEKNKMNDKRFDSVFIHVPHQDTIPVDYQIRFAKHFVSELLDMYSGQE